jgi:hypothetical protein
MAQEKSTEEQIAFANMTRDERSKAVARLIEAGYSDKMVAIRFGSTKNTIVGIRRDYDIKANFRPGFKDVPRSSSGVVLRLGSPWNQCEAVGEDRLRCAYEPMPGSRYCALPQHQALAKQKERS